MGIVERRLIVEIELLRFFRVVSAMRSHAIRSTIIHTVSTRFVEKILYLRVA